MYDIAFPIVACEIKVVELIARIVQKEPRNIATHFHKT
jgi:hypothetical protein